MREDEEEFRHYVPLLRRIIILVAVITAVPVILWTITAFVRTYVGPPKIPTFHQLASTASINVPSDTASADANAKLRSAMQQAASGNPPAATVETRATVADARDAPPAPKGPLLAERAPDADGDAPAQGGPRSADVVAAAPVASRGADVFPPSPLAVADTATPSGTGAVGAAQAAATEPAADALPASAPLSGPIPLPRRRPHDLGAVHTADLAPSNVPMPRPRPDATGASAPAETTGGASPLGFIQSLFH